MADRVEVYQNELLLNQDILYTNKNMMIAVAKLSEAILGSSTQLNGLACTPTSPASLLVNVAPGEIYQLLNTDNTTYGTLPPDSHPILKQGIVFDIQQFTFTAPVTVGYSVNYLIQVTLTEEDVD